MKLTFRCPGCGKRLKTQPECVGRTRKCPVCATRVTCMGADLEPGPVPVGAVPAGARAVPSAAKAVPAAEGRDASPGPASRFAPFDDVHDDPYRLAEPEPMPARTPAPEARRPCPVCGETILASAARCSSCGEYLNGKPRKKKARKSRKSRSGGLNTTGLRDIGIGIACMAAGIGLTAFTYANAVNDGPGGGRYLIFHGLMIGGFIQMCRGFYGLFTG